MKAGTIHILDLDFEFKLWKNRLQCYQSELDIVQGRVFVLTREHPAFELSKTKMLILNDQQEKVKLLHTRIKNMEQEMALYAEDYPIDEKHLHYSLHEEIRDEMEQLQMKQNEIINAIIPDLCYPITIL